MDLLSNLRKILSGAQDTRYANRIEKCGMKKEQSKYSGRDKLRWQHADGYGLLKPGTSNENGCSSLAWCHFLQQRSQATSLVLPAVGGL